MKNILALNTSLNGDNGNSNKLVNAFIEKLQNQEQVNVTHRDLAADDLPHLSSAEMGAWMTAVDERSEEQKALAAVSDNLVQEVLDNDVIVLGMPMYNFGVPSQFKAWVDRIARAGITFRYTETGPAGMVEGKKVYILAARGGLYAGTPKDTQTNYLKDFFAFIGITDVEFVYAEGLAMGPESFGQAFDKAEEKIAELIGEIAA